MYVRHIQVGADGSVGSEAREGDVKQAHDAALPPATALQPFVHDPAALERLDRAFLRMRRILVRPEVAALPIPSLGRTVEFAKVMACLAIAEGPDLVGLVHPPTVKDIAALLQLDHSTTSRLLTEAEAEGLLVRATDDEDRRRTIVELTDAGRSVVADSSAIRAWAIGALLADWSPSDVATFTEYLERMTATFGLRMPAILEAAHAHFDPSAASSEQHT